MNLYRALGDRVGTPDARNLAQQLMDWHDAMVRHLRLSARDGSGCHEECPHAEARALWAAAVSVFGEHVDALGFLRRHGRGGAQLAGAGGLTLHG